MSTPSTIPSEPRTRSLTIEALDEYREETLLLQIALQLVEQKLRPRTLTWTAPRNSRAIQISLVLPVGDEAYEHLVGQFRNLPGVTSVAPLDYDEPPPRTLG